jgi:hypothetical protein
MFEPFFTIFQVEIEGVALLLEVENIFWERDG